MARSPYGQLFATVALLIVARASAKCPIAIADIESSSDFKSELKSSGCDVKAKPSSDMCKACTCGLANGIGSTLDKKGNLTKPEALDIYLQCETSMQNSTTGEAVTKICGGTPFAGRECDKLNKPMSKFKGQLAALRDSCPASADQIAASAGMKAVMKQGPCATLAKDGSASAACPCSCDLLDKVQATPAAAKTSSGSNSSVSTGGPLITIAECKNNIAAAMQKAYGASPAATAALWACNSTIMDCVDAKHRPNNATKKSSSREVKAPVFAVVSAVALVLLVVL